MFNTNAKLNNYGLTTKLASQTYEIVSPELLIYIVIL